MTSCAQCKHRIISKETRVNCNGCKRYIHERCLTRFLSSAKKEECCSRNFDTTVNSAISGPILSRIGDQTTACTSRFDSTRNLYLNNSFLSVNSMS